MRRFLGIGGLLVLALAALVAGGCRDEIPATAVEQQAEPDVVSLLAVMGRKPHAVAWDSVVQVRCAARSGCRLKPAFQAGAPCGYSAMCGFAALRAAVPV